MRTLNFFNLMVVLAAAFFTWNAVAAPTSTVHVLENLTPAESKEMKLMLKKMGYIASHKSLFNESKNAIIITKALPTETEGASLTIEMVHLESDSSIPHTIFKYKTDGTDMKETLTALPKPEIMNQDSMTMPVAFQK